MSSNKTVFERFVTLILVLYGIGLLVHLGTRTDACQWDFQAQYRAAEAFGRGENPYDGQYTYPPITLFFYQLFTFAGYRLAFQIFLGVKCILLIGLILLWKEVFLRREAGALFYLFCLLAFNSAFYLDLRAGNINLFETFMLWMAFSFYLKGRPVLFCASVFCAAVFKITPLFFLALLFFSKDRKRLAYVSGTLVLFGAYLWIQYMAAPALFVDFLRNVFVVLEERGVSSPSTLTFVKELFELLAQRTDIAISPFVPQLTFAGVGAAIVLLTHRAYLALQGLPIEDKAKVVLFLACLVYGLIHPRFKDYAYLLLLVPTYFILTRPLRAKACIFLFLIVVLFSRNPAHADLPGIEPFFDLAWEYYPLLVAYTIWGLYLYEIRALEKSGHRESRSLGARSAVDLRNGRST